MYRAIVQILILVTGFMLLTSCSSVVDPNPGQRIPGGPAINAINATMRGGLAVDRRVAKQGKFTIPDDISSALLPELSIDSNNVNSATDVHRFDLAVKDMPVNTFFASLVKGTKYNILVNPKIKGNITLSLRNVTIQDVLDAVENLYGYQHKKTSYGYEVFPGGLQTHIFTLNYLDVVRQGQSDMFVSSTQLTTSSSTTSTSTTTNNTATRKNEAAGSSVSTKTKSDFWAGVTNTLKALIGDEKGTRVVVNATSGIIVIRAYPDELQQVTQYLDSLRATSTRQVLIEARILEVTLSDSYQAGIDWKILGAKMVSTGTTPLGTAGADDALTSFTGLFSFSHGNLDTNSFAYLISLLSTQGNVQVLSSPRISTLNNQQAVIKVGTDAYYVTNVTGLSTSSTGGTTDTQDVDLEPFFSGIALDVTPQIDSHGGVTLHIHPMVSTVSSEDITIQLGVNAGGDAQTQVIPTAKSKIREADSIVHAENGQIVIIGGLMENSTTENQAGVPAAAKIPFLGALFRRVDQSAQKTELVILLKPMVIDNNSWRKPLQESAHNFKMLNRGYHVGDQPQDFGNLGEYQDKKLWKHKKG
jgi:MSHA biogenesis protein MshL